MSAAARSKSLRIAMWICFVLAFLPGFSFTNRSGTGSGATEGRTTRESRTSVSFGLPFSPLFRLERFKTETLPDEDIPTTVVSNRRTFHVGILGWSTLAGVLGGALWFAARIAKARESCIDAQRPVVPP